MGLDSHNLYETCQNGLGGQAPKRVHIIFLRLCPTEHAKNREEKKTEKISGGGGQKKTEFVYNTDDRYLAPRLSTWPPSGPPDNFL